MISYLDLFKKSLNLYKNRFFSLFLISLVQFLPFVVLIPVYYNFQRINVSLYNQLLDGKNSYLVVAEIFIPIFLYAVVFIIIQTWSMASLITEITSSVKLGFAKSFINSWPHLRRYWWVSGLCTILITGSSLFFVIPGIILSVWFVFSLYILSTLNYSGLKALIVSREYVRNYYWQIFIRLLLLLVIYGFFSLILDRLIVSFELDKSIFGSLITLVSNSATAPFLAIYVFQIFLGVYQKKGKIDLKVTSKMMIQYSWLGVVGFLVVFFVMPYSLISSANPSKQITNARETMSQSNRLSIELAIERYYLTNGNWPKSTDALLLYEMKKIPVDPDENICYLISITKDSQIQIDNVKKTGAECPREINML